MAQEATPPAAAPDPNAVIATIDGQDITEADLALAASELDEQFARLPEEQKRAAALSALIEIRLMAADAAKKGIDKDETFVRRMELLRQRALHAAVIEQTIVGTITEADIRARYDKHVAETPPVNEVKARHILVETKEEADAIIKRLDAGEDFETIAKEVSKDPGSGANGGDLGWFGPGQMVPEFEQAAFALEVGAHSKEPVQSQFGFHIIKVEDKRQQQPPAYEQVKDQFRTMLIRERYFALVSELRGAATIDIKDPALKAAVDGIDGAK
ncbi:MAG: peptidylprolyl isomerase [Rhizobiaceae bacterium]